MPTIPVPRDALMKLLERDYTTEEFDELCFEFGIELDGDEDGELKIELPANRYDLLNLEVGLSLALRVFNNLQEMPQYSLNPAKEVLEIKPETAQIRSLCSAVVLRGIKFTQQRYDSFISLQDKLHQNLARQRTLVSIGTHDLDSITGPFSYEALKPEDIEFAPLNQTKTMNGKQLMEFYEKDKHLGRYLHIIRDSPVYPVIYDANRTVLSLPPIINGNHSKITLDTKNCLIEVTATDQAKLDIVTNLMAVTFAGYCDSIEAVEIKSPHNNQSRTTPDLRPTPFQADVADINSVTGLKLSPEEIANLLKRMGYTATSSKTDSNILDVSVPVTRPDVLHQADIREDVAIAYGFNKLPRTYTSTAPGVAAPLFMNKLADIVRLEACASGWLEVMPLILCSIAENFQFLNRTDNGEAVKLANPKTAEYQVARTSLLPGLLKSLSSNRHHAMPIKCFEVQDVVLVDRELERKSRNERHFAAAWMGKTSGFEQVHGLLDRVVSMLKLALTTREESVKPEVLEGYWIEEANDPTFLAGHAANIFVKLNGQVTQIGVFGILHPSVLKNFELSYPVSTVEFNLEVFL